MAARKKPAKKPAKKRSPRKKPKQAYHHGELRESLLLAAVAVIAERGVAGLSLRECARRAGVSHAAPYRHFEDKDALLRAIAHQGFARLVEQGRAAMEAHDAPRDRLDAYGVAYVRFAIAHPEHHRVMFTSEFEAGKDGKDGQVGQAEKDDTDPGAFDLLVEATSAVLEDGADPLPAAFAFWSLVHGVSMLVLDGRVPAEHLADIEGLVRASFAYWRAS